LLFTDYQKRTSSTMTSSQALSISGGPGTGNFPQAGQLDWVSLSRLSITCTWEVAARLCNAGVDTVTVLAGTGLCSSLSFPPAGQVELANSLSRLKGCSSYSKLLWFGLGIKHIVNDLCTTERGAACVAISAALAVPYTSFQAAQIWRELAMLKGAPRNLIPATHQWAALVKVCAGCLANSKFSNYFEQFSRFLAPEDRESRAPAPAKDIARALATLADLSSNTLLSSTFIGGVECAWLATIAEYLLRLEIEIQDENGRFIYGSGNSVQNTSVRAVFRRQSNPSLPSPGAVVQQVCFISKGEHLLQERVNFTASAILNPTSWSKILSDSFSNSKWEQFMAPPMKSSFNRLMVSVALHSRFYFSSHNSIDKNDFSLWWLRLYPHGCLYHPRRSGDELLKFAREQFPEISFLDSTESLGQLSARQTRAKIELSLEQIANACGCTSCEKTSTKGKSPPPGLCFKRMALTIVRLILILSPVAVNEHIPPSTTALKQLYNCTIEPTSDRPPVTFPCSGVPLILFLFTGRLPTWNVPDHVSAASASGICVFLTVLKDLDLSPLDATGIEVIPGHISHEDHFYTFITDMNLLSEEFSEFISREPNGSELFELSVRHFELIVEEQEDNTTLGASYKAVYSNNQNIYICLEALQTSLRSLLRTNIPSIDECSPSFEEEPSGRRWSFHGPTSKNTPEQLAISGNVSSACWSILVWDSWKLASGEHSQWLDIEVFKADNMALFVIAHELYHRYAFDTSWNRRSHVVLTQLGDCPDCLVRIAALAWSTIPADMPTRGKLDANAPTVRSVLMNELKKKGSIRWREYIHGDRRESVAFELTLIHRKEDSSTASKLTFKRLLRSPRSDGKR
jgi:hypothetical protein